MTKKEKRALVLAAREAMRLAYAPYSGCRVGAALLTSGGKVYTGFNIENAAFTPTVCAERSALIRALHEGERDFAAIAVIGENTRLPEAGGSFYPCGVCRQFMREFCPPDLVILVADPSGECFEELTLDALLPHGFGPENVKGEGRS